MLFQWHNSHVLNIDWIHQPLLVFCINFVQICCSTTSIFIRHGPILEFITLCDWLIVICSFFRSNLGGVYVTLGWLLPRSEFTPVPSHGSIFYFVYMIPPQNVLPARVALAWVHPGSCTGARIEYQSDDVIKMKFVKLWDLLSYSERTTSKTPTRQKLAIRGKLSLRY